MGILADARALFSRPVSLLSAAAVASVATSPAPVIPSKSEGIPGGGNYSGRIIVEPNSALRDQAGYGRAGTYEPGEWEEIALSNPYVTAGLDFILGPVADARVDVEPAGEDSGVPEAVAKEHADFIKWALTEKFPLTTHIESAASGFLLSGFALYEPVAQLVTREGRDCWTLKALEQRLPNSLNMDSGAWLESDDGKLLGIKQRGPQGMGGRWVQPVLPADRVLLYSWKRKGNNWQGVSQLRSVWYIAGRVMPLLLKLAGVTVQREGAGLPLVFKKDEAQGAAELTPSQRTELMNFLANLTFHESSGGILPEGWDMKFIFSPGADKTFIIDIWKSLGLVVLMQLGAQQLVLGTDNTGSRSVGEVHDARSMAFVRKVLRFEEGILNGDSGEAHTGLVKRLIDWNYGPQPAYPRAKLTPQRPELAPSDLATAVKSAKDAGLFTPTAEDENTFRERAGFAPITEEERAAAKEKAAALAPPSPFGGAAGGEEPGGKPQLKASAQRGTWQPWRPLRASESKLRLREMDAFFVAQREAYDKAARPLVSVMMGSAAVQIAAAMRDGKVQPAEVAALTFNTKRLDALNRDFLAKWRAAGGDFVREELGAPVLRAAGEPDESPAAAKAEADEVTDAQANALLRRQVARARAELEREAIDALRTGDDAESVVTRALEAQLDSGAFKADAGTVLTKAFNVGRDEAARILGGVETVELSAILDSATCEACVALDGTEADFNSAEHDRLVPPVRDCAGRDNCRCLLLFKRGGA